MIERPLTMVSAGRLGGGAEASESWRCGRKGRGSHQFRAISPSTRMWQQVSGDSRQQDQVYVMASPEVEGFLGYTTCASINWNKSDSWKKKTQNIEWQRRASHQSPSKLSTPGKEAWQPNAGAAKVWSPWQPSLWLPRLHSHQSACVILPD